MKWIIALIFCLSSQIAVGECYIPSPPPKPEPKPKPKPEPKPKPDPYPEGEWIKVKTALEVHCAYSGCHDGTSQEDSYLVSEEDFLTRGCKRLKAEMGRDIHPPKLPKDRWEKWQKEGWIIVFGYLNKHRCGEYK